MTLRGRALYCGYMSDYSEKHRGFGGNLVQQKRMKPPHKPWFCPQCQKPVAAHWNQCPVDGQPRVNEYE